MEAAQELYGIPDRCSIDNHGGRSHQYTDQRIQLHRSGQREGLADHLGALVAGKAREVGNVERNRGPEADCCVQRWNQEFEKVWKAAETGWCREHWSEAASPQVGPSKQKQADAEQDWRANALQKSDVLNAFENHRQVDEPECQETNAGAVRH